MSDEFALRKVCMRIAICDDAFEQLDFIKKGTLEY